MAVWQNNYLQVDKQKTKKSKSGENPLKKFRAPVVRCTPRLCLQVSMECAFAKQQSMVFALIKKTEPFFQDLFCKTKAIVGGDRSERRGGKRRHRDLDKPATSKDSRKHHRILLGSVCRGGQKVGQ